MNNKKAQMGTLMTVAILLVSAAIIFGITAEFFRVADTGLQDAICRANVVGGGAFVNGESGEGVFQRTANWVGKEAVQKSLKNPLCTTKTHIIDVSNVNDKEQQLETITLQMGEMIENCWKTFGEGRVVNTFGQENKIFWFRDDKSNYYFNCYKFKVQLPNSKLHIDIDELNGEDGSLWKYGVRGNKIADTIQESAEKYFESEDQDDLSYAGYVFGEGNGYIEFVNTINYATEHSWDGVDLAEIAAGTAIAAGIVGITVAFPPAGIWLGAAYVGASASATVAAQSLTSQAYLSVVPQNNNKITQIDSDTWYEIRYYSPYMGEKPDGLILNNIKIMPAGAPGGTELEPIAIS